MRRILHILMIYSLFCGLAFGEDVLVTLPEFEVTVGSETIDTKHSIYPVFVYNDMTYFPLTSDYVSGLGLDLVFDADRGLDISKTVPDIFEQRFLAHMNHKNDFTAKYLPFPVTINGQVINNQLEPYPLLLYKDITYFPMTWKFAHDTFGLDYVYNNDEGLVINGTTEKNSLEPERLILSVGRNYKEVGITFNMATDEPVEVMVYNDSLELLHGYTITSDRQVILDKMYHVYKTTMINLNMDEKYYYRIKSQTEQSKLYSFNTLNEETTLAFFGDIQGYKLDQYKDFYSIYLNAHENNDIDLTYLAGDIVDNGDSIKEWSFFDQATLGSFSNNILVSAIGNHDVKNSSYIYEQTFNYPKNGVNGLNERNFYFDLPNARVAVWDTETFSQYDEQSEWLKEIMSDTKKFKIVLMHRSVYPMLYDEPIVRRLAGTFEDASIDLVLSGHDHIYNRTTMYQNEKVTPNDGVTYIVGGSGSGSKYYNEQGNRHWKHVIYDENNPVYTTVNITNDTIKVFAYAIVDDKLKSIDELIISK